MPDSHLVKRHASKHDIAFYRNFERVCHIEGLTAGLVCGVTLTILFIEIIWKVYG